MTNEEMAKILARQIEYQNTWLCEQMFNPSAVVVFPSYQDWMNNRPICDGDIDISLERYWKERKEAIRMFALAELDGESRW